MLMRFDPFRDFDRLARDARPSRRSSLMAMDAFRQGDSVTANFDLPGVDPETIDITVEKNELKVTAERGWHRDDDIEVVASERPQGSFSRTLFLGDGLDPEHIRADYTDGVLTLSIPVAETAKPRKISVGTTPAELVS